MMAAQLHRYAELLGSGVLSISEVASAILEMLIESADPVETWVGSPASLRRSVLDYLADIGADTVPPMFWIGPGESDPTRRSSHTVRRREVAAKLLAEDALSRMS